MLICEYCGAGNSNDVRACTSCGAPRRHNFKKFTSPLYDLISSTTEAMWEVRGYDCSAWNGDQDGIKTMQRTQFGFIRAGWGNTGIDPRLAVYRDICATVGIEFGLYWYAKAGFDWRAHANSFYTVWKENPGNLNPVIDAEYTSLPVGQTATWIYNLVHEMEQKTGKRVMIYTGPGWWNAHVARNEWAQNQPLWVAHWTTAAQPIVPYDWQQKGWVFWQHSADSNCQAAEYGFTNGDPDLDLNRYNGSIDDFNTLYGTNIQPIGTVEPPPPAVEIVPLYKAQVTATALNVRSLPNVCGADLGDLRYGDILPVVEERDGWLRIEGWISKDWIRKVT